MEIPRPILIPKEPYVPPREDDIRSKSSSSQPRRSPFSRGRRSPSGRSPGPRDNSDHLSSSSVSTSRDKRTPKSPYLSIDAESLTTLDLADAVNDGDVKGMNKVIDMLILNTIINAQDSRGMTPLHLAVKRGYEDVCVNLLHRGADITKRDAMGWTPLFWAVMEGHTDLVHLLIRRGSSITELDDSGATLLHFAAMEGHTDLVRYLLEQGADVHTQDSFGATAMSRACMQGHEEAALVLMEAGADFTMPDGQREENLPPLARAALLFCEDFGFPSHLKKTTYADVATWTKEDGVLDVLSSDSEVSEEEEGTLAGDKESLGKWFRPLHERSSYSIKSKSAVLSDSQTGSAPDAKDVTGSGSLTTRSDQASASVDTADSKDPLYALGVVGEGAFESVEGTPRSDAGSQAGTGLTLRKSPRAGRK